MRRRRSKSRASSSSSASSGSRSRSSRTSTRRTRSSPTPSTSASPAATRTRPFGAPGSCATAGTSPPSSATASIELRDPVECTIDLGGPGRQVGRLEIPKSTNTGGWAHQFIPIASIANGDGPTALVLGGNHGDEYEGQVAGLKLLRELRPELVSGRVIVIPCLSPEASRAGTRLWPNGVNFNRSFPGRIDGPANEQLAHFLSTVLFPLSDYVIDIHSGGNSARFIPCSHMHVVDDPAQRKAMLEGMQAWC